MEPEIPADPKPSTRKRMVIMIVAVGLLLGLLAGFNIFKNIMIGRALQGGQEPPQTVTTTQVHQERWQPTLSAVGTLRAIHGADLAFEVPGALRLACPANGTRRRRPGPSADENAWIPMGGWPGPLR